MHLVTLGCFPASEYEEQALLLRGVACEILPAYVFHHDFMPSILHRMAELIVCMNSTSLTAIALLYHMAFWWS